MGRKIILSVISILIVAALFIGYLRLTGTKGIMVSNVSHTQDVSFGQLDPNAQRIGGTVIHSVNQTRYTILDPQTKRIHRIFGFERLLNPGSATTHWQVEKPYLHFNEKQLVCRMDAEQGIFQMDTSGGSPVPQDAQFSGKVVIRLIPAAGQRFSETVILMDDLNYSSERSEFFTDGPVELVSAQSRLVGKGLLLAYHPGLTQIDYFEVKHLDYLRLKRAVTSNLLGESEKSKTTPRTPSEPNLSPSQAAAKEPNTNGAAAVPHSDPNTEGLFYQCILNDSVRIVYGDQAIVDGADRICISNVLLGERNAKQEEPLEPNQPEISSRLAEKSDANEPAIQKIEEVPWASRAARPATPADDDTQDVVVTCRGKLIFKPIEKIQAVASAALSVSESSSLEPNSAAGGPAVSTEKEQLEPAQKGVYFKARAIDYNLTDGSVLATGPIAFRFEASADSNDANSVFPVVITAQENAEFLADGNKSIRQVVFCGNVIGDATEKQSEAQSTRRLYGDRLTVDLADMDGKTKMSHVAVTGQKVRLEAVDYLNGIKSSHVRLNCRRFDYDEAAQAIVAAGPGEIQLNNKDVAVDPNAAAKSLDFQGPCVALINGFDVMTWRRPDNKIQVDSSQDSMKLSYMTIKDGKPDLIVNAQTMYAEILTGQNAAGRSVLKEVTADKGVFVEQVGTHTLKGQKLRYLGEDGWLYIAGDTNQPCFVDGAKVPTIQYNLLTGQLKTTLSSSPGAVGLPQK